MTIHEKPSSLPYYKKPIFVPEVIKNRIITKSIGYLLLAVMFYMHVCSALCATSTHGCCGKDDKDNDQDKKECCKHEKESDGKENDCQVMHLSFFNTTGQFAQVKADISLKPFQNLIAVVTPLFIIQPTVTSKNKFAYSGFHLPPPKAGTRIFIQSFQI